MNMREKRDNFNNQNTVWTATNLNHLLRETIRPRLPCTGFAGDDIFVCCPGATFSNEGLLFR
jgi:hypothetical protein